MADHETPSVGEPPPTYIIFLMVFLFFITGLLGFLVCHLLKKKGYRCELEDDEEACEDKLETEKDDESDDSQDTVEQILKCIIENKANTEAFKDMLGGQNVCEHHDPWLRHKDSIDGPPLHHHTIHLGGEISSCVHCRQGHVLKTRRRSRMFKSKARPGEQTVFSVGRFRVTHMEKKPSLQGSINLPTPKPGDVSNDTTLSGIKDTSKKPQEEYNIRNMFKDGATNGTVPNVGKRKKSLPLLGFYKGNNPVGTKVVPEMFVEDKEGQKTADQLSVSLEECLSSAAVFHTDPETALGKNSNKGSAHKLEKTVHESSSGGEISDRGTSDVISQDKLNTKTTVTVCEWSSDRTRFSVVRTEEETIITSTTSTEDRGNDNVPEDNTMTDKDKQQNPLVLN